MPKKTDSPHENRGKSSMEHGGQKEGREQRGGRMDDSRQQGRKDGSGKQDDLRQHGRQDGSTNQEDFRQQNREQGPVNLGGLRNLLRGNRQLLQGTGGLGEGAKKNGCLPRLFMLALPFMTIGAYLLLGS